MSTVVPFRDDNKMQPESNSWLPLIGLIAASAVITILATVGAVDLVGRVL